MQVKINSQILAAELRLMGKIVPNKPAIQVLGHVLLRAEDRLTFYATDLEVGLLATCDATITEPGLLALPLAHLLPLVEQFPDSDVLIASDKTHVKISCNNFKSKLQAYAADDFPAVPQPEGTVSSLNMATLISKTRYAINAGNAKHVLQGALLTLQGGAAAMVTTDGKRLAMATTSCEGDDALVIVHAKTLDFLAAETDVEMTVGAQQFFRLGDRLLISRSLDGTFPKYEHIIPRENDKTVTVSRTVLAAALRRVRLVSASSRAVYFSLDANTIGLSAASAEVGTADEAVACSYVGEPLRFCVNGDSVMDFLDSASGQSITMRLKDARTAMLLLDGVDHVGVVGMMQAKG